MKTNYNEQSIVAANSYKDLGVLFMEAIKELYKTHKTLYQLCGPIATNKNGTIEENLKVFDKGIDALSNLGLHVIDQMPYEPRMQEIKQEREKNLGGGYDDTILTDFYLPIFESKLVSVLVFLPGWRDSYGSCWEYFQGKEQGMQLLELVPNWAELIESGNSILIEDITRPIIENSNTIGKLIVLDGTDGSGKATQARELVARFVREGKRVETLDFPQYQKFFGKLIGECLNGEHGDWAKIDPKIASVLYAADRFDASVLIKQWLAEGAIVILDRYVSSNQIHQGGKISDDQERAEFLAWLDTMEHEVFQIPRPDAIIYLDVPIEITQRLLKEKSANDKKEYKTSGTDAHEDDIDHLIAAKESGLKMISSNSTWHRIQCYENNVMLPINVIHEKIWEFISYQLIAFKPKTFISFNCDIKGRAYNKNAKKMMYGIVNGMSDDYAEIILFDSFEAVDYFRCDYPDLWSNSSVATNKNHDKYDITLEVATKEEVILYMNSLDDQTIKEKIRQFLI